VRSRTAIGNTLGGNNGSSYGGYDDGGYGHSGYYGGNQFGDFITTLEYLLGPKHDPSYYLPTYTGIPTPYPGTATAKSSPAKLAKPVGTGASNVYSGGGNRRTNMSSSGGGGWEFAAGLATTAGNTAFYSKKYGIWMGKNLKLYNLNYHGGGIGGMKFSKFASRAFQYAGWGLGAYNFIKMNKENHWKTDYHTVSENLSNGISTFGGIYGAAWSLGWEGGSLITNTELYQNIKFNYYYNHWEDLVGKPSEVNEDLWYNFYQNYNK